MQIVIDIPNEVKQVFDKADDVNFSYYDYNSVIGKAIRNGTPLKILDDGTLAVTIDDYTKVKRILVQDKDNNGGLFYADSN